jgi:hypothetical protein
VSAVTGVFLGYFFMKIKKLGYFAIGCWLGYVLSLILYSLFLYKIKSNPPEVIIFIHFKFK